MGIFERTSPEESLDQFLEELLKLFIEKTLEEFLIKAMQCSSWKDLSE